MTHEPAPLPSNEQARIEALHDYAILDTPPEQAFDTLVSIAAELFEVPTALVSLVDRERQWFKARVGLDACETHRDLAFCAHAILSREPLIIADALEDARFAGNPLVSGAPFIRFYAGAPLITPDGLHLGTLCVIDAKPHHPTPAQVSRLRELAQLVVDQLELRRSALRLREQSHSLERQRETLERINVELDHFVESAAHDLRAPLRHVMGFGRLLEKALEGRASEKARGYLGRILDSTRRMDELLCALYEYARSAGQLEPESLAMDLLLESVLEDLELPSGELAAQVRVGPLPTVQADAMQLRRVLQNLLDNALKYAAATAEEPRIEVSAKRVTGQWQIDVADNGPGLDAEQREVVFEPFRRVCANTDVDGVGMGLTLCKRIVERMGGRIWVESKPGEGCRFCFTLPASNGDESGVVDSH